MTLQTNTTPTSLLFPWFPSSARKTTKQATADLFIMLAGYVEARRAATQTTDAIDVMIAEGFDTTVIVGVRIILTSFTELSN